VLVGILLLHNSILNMLKHAILSKKSEDFTKILKNK